MSTKDKTKSSHPFDIGPDLTSVSFIQRFSSFCTGTHQPLGDKVPDRGARRTRGRRVYRETISPPLSFGGRRSTHCDISQFDFSSTTVQIRCRRGTRQTHPTPVPGESVLRRTGHTSGKGPTTTVVLHITPMEPQVEGHPRGRTPRPMVHHWSPCPNPLGGFLGPGPFLSSLSWSPWPVGGPLGSQTHKMTSCTARLHFLTNLFGSPPTRGGSGLYPSATPRLHSDTSPVSVGAGTGKHRQLWERTRHS